MTVTLEQILEKRRALWALEQDEAAENARWQHVANLAEEHRKRWVTLVTETNQCRNDLAELIFAFGV